MPNAPNPPSLRRVVRGQVREALDRFEDLVVDEIRHGFFERSVTCEVGNGGKRHLVIRAGKSDKLTTPSTNCRTEPVQDVRTTGDP
jgi:hypothetical protein